MLISPDYDLALALREDLPAKRLGPEPGQPRQVVSVDDDVMKSDRHADSLLDTLEGIPQNALFCRPYGKLSPALTPGMAQRGVPRYAR